jgi:hypothetical protein
MSLLSGVDGEKVYINPKPMDVKAGEKKITCQYRPMRETKAPARAAQTTVPKR